MGEEASRRLAPETPPSRLDLDATARWWDAVRPQLREFASECRSRRLPRTKSHVQFTLLPTPAMWSVAVPVNARSTPGGGYVLFTLLPTGGVFYRAGDIGEGHWRRLRGIRGVVKHARGVSEGAAFDATADEIREAFVSTVAQLMEEKRRRASRKR